MKTIIIYMCLAFASASLCAQNNIDTILRNIEKNNTQLKALRETAEAQKLGNKTGIYLDNPEVGFNYLWGKPGEIANRTDINVKQNIDIPTIAGTKSKIADGQNNMLELEYKSDRMNILLEAKQYCIELIYYNALRRELDVRLKHAETIAESYKSRLDRGDANRLEYNKVQLNLSTVQCEILRIDIERNALLLELKRLNGGANITLDDYQYNSLSFPVNFDDWLAQITQKSPVLEYAKQGVEVGKKQISLSKAMRLPVFSVGYMSEKTAGQQYQGFTFGFSIPLWENKNRVKQAKAAIIAAELREIDCRQQLFSQLQILYNRVDGLKVTVEKCRQSLIAINNTDLLKKALDAGEISLLDYILEIGLYYNTVNHALEAERDYQKAFAELFAIEL